MSSAGERGAPVVAVVGASSGIGRAIAARFAQGGAKVVALARRFEGAGGELEVGVVVERALDVTSAAQIGEVFARLERLDHLILCAGDGHFGTVLETPAERLRELLEVSVVGTLRCVQAAVPLMVSGGGGHIVWLGSVATEEVFADCGAYAAAKAGKRALLRALREECRSTHVTVTELVVGAVDTALWDARPGFDRSSMMAPEDVAAAVFELAQHRALSVEQVVLKPLAGNL